MFIFPWKSFTRRKRLHRRKRTFFNHCLSVGFIAKVDISSTVYLFVLIILHDIYPLFKKDHHLWILLRTLLGNTVSEEFMWLRSTVDEVLSLQFLSYFVTNVNHIFKIIIDVKGFASSVMEKQVWYLKEKTKFSYAYKAILKFSRKKIKFLSFPLNHPVY